MDNYHKAIKTFIWLMLCALLLVLLACVVPLLKQFGFAFTYVKQASIEPGFYIFKGKQKHYSKADKVAFVMPQKLREAFKLQTHQERWVIKPIIAVSGDLVCLKEDQVLVNQENIGLRRQYGKNKQSLPQIDFCRALNKGEYWVMSDYSIYSFDSRYLGPITQEMIRAKVKGV